MANQENDVSHQKPQVAVVMVPLPAQGHLNQLLHLSRLISAVNLPVYYIGAATHIRQAKLRLHGWNPSSSINFHEFPNPQFQNPNPNPNSPTKFPLQILPSFSAAKNLRAPVLKFVKNLSKKFKRIVVIYDSLMTYVVQDLDSWANAGKPDLSSDPGLSSILKEIPGPDGFFPPEFAEFRALQRGSRKFFSGDIYNSSRIIEDVYLNLLSTGSEKKWAVGPFNPVLINQSGLPRHKSLDWLDKQVLNSVIFVSFGTTSSLSDEQVHELAIGLEKSGQKFIWVLREADKGDIFTGSENRKFELPDGFEERVKERGLIVRDWAPQLEILAHFSTGGFLSHCGWNSCMESISMGVPMATWPMHSDQPTNAVLVTKVLRIGVEVRDWACREDVVPSGVVENSVKKLMASGEGDEMRKRARELGDGVKSSLMEDVHTPQFAYKYNNISLKIILTSK
ncbi:hypothetical protein DH2020_038947 [Rehmannia glutinosa]|uniref:Glycosyltransferase n=1 Tax=Rehmannia glutinosa TaxID=99300 RepID=A0ABR0UX46_REHGL